MSKSSKRVSFILARILLWSRMLDWSTSSLSNLSQIRAFVYFNFITFDDQSVVRTVLGISFLTKILAVFWIPYNWKVSNEAFKMITSYFWWFHVEILVKQGRHMHHKQKDILLEQSLYNRHNVCPLYAWVKCKFNSRVTHNISQEFKVSRSKVTVFILDSDIVFGVFNFLPGSMNEKPINIHRD